MLRLRRLRGLLAIWDFMSGPDALSDAWKRPCRRSLARARHVRSLGLSLVEVVVAFNVFVASILRFHFQLVPLCSEVINDVGLAIDGATATPRLSLGSGVLSHLRLLGFHAGIHHLAVTARASAYRAAKQSEVFCDLCDMLDVAADSDDAILYPRQAEWRLSSPANLLRKIAREVEVVLGIVGLPSGELQRRVVGVLSNFEGGGELVKVLARRIEHFGFEFCDTLAQDLILNFNCAAKFVKPFVSTAVIKTVYNAWPTSRRHGHNIASHCRLGCFAVAGDDLRHCPFCPVVEGFIRNDGDLGVCLWFKNRSLGHM